MANKKVRTGFELRAHTMDLASKLLDSLKQLPYSEANTMLDTISEELGNHGTEEVETPSKGKPKK